MPKKEADFGFLMEILKETKVDENPDIAALADVRQEHSRIQARRDRAVINQTGLIFALHHPHSMTTRACTNCGKVFLTPHCRDSICSDFCRMEEFERHFGVPWDAISTTSEYIYERHATLDATETRNLLRLITRILRDEAVTISEILGDKSLPEELSRLLDRIEEERADFEREQTKTRTPEPAPVTVGASLSETSEGESLEFPSFSLDFDESPFDLTL